MGPNDNKNNSGGWIKTDDDTIFNQNDGTIIKKTDTGWFNLGDGSFIPDHSTGSNGNDGNGGW